MERLVCVVLGAQLTFDFLFLLGSGSTLPVRRCSERRKGGEREEEGKIPHQPKQYHEYII